MAKNNVPIMGLSPANEPDYIASWDGAQWTPTELTTFISQNLGPTFAQRFPSVKLIAPDTASWPNVDKYLTPLLADPAAKDYLSVVATHPYQNGSDRRSNSTTRSPRRTASSSGSRSGRRKTRRGIRRTPR